VAGAVRGLVEGHGRRCGIENTMKQQITSVMACGRTRMGFAMSTCSPNADTPIACQAQIERNAPLSISSIH
jgi:hypothetical protein